MTPQLQSIESKATSSVSSASPTVGCENRLTGDLEHHNLGHCEKRRRARTRRPLRETISASATCEMRVLVKRHHECTPVSSRKISSSSTLKTLADDGADCEFTGKAASRTNETSADGKAVRLRDATSMTRDSSPRAGTSSRSSGRGEGGGCTFRSFRLFFWTNSKVKKLTFECFCVVFSWFFCCLNPSERQIQKHIFTFEFVCAVLQCFFLRFFFDPFKSNF